MTDLTKETKDQIIKDAEAYCKKYGRMTTGYYFLNYQAGATAWAIWKQKAEAYQAIIKRAKDIISAYDPENGDPGGVIFEVDNVLHLFS